ncbi:MAG: Fe-S cluster assembly protein SufD [Rhizobiales bacterium]|nr:Fe-S cluster assembly protein SufD [Hyphomicrobiales bacterium]
MAIATQKTAAETAYLEGFDAGGDWLAAERQKGFDAFAVTGLPHRRMEDWKWTDLRQLIGKAYPPAKGGAVGDIDALAAKCPLKDIARGHLTFVNGEYDAGRSQLPASGDVEVTALSTASSALPIGETAADPIDGLNRAYVTDGAFIRIKAGSNADAPLELVFINSSRAEATFTTRNVIELEDGASATVFETHMGGHDAYVSNSVTEVRLGNGARLDRVKLQMEGAASYHLSNLKADLGAEAKLQDFTLTMGSATTRQQGFITFNGEHTDATVSGAFLLNRKQHNDTRLVVDHKVPNCVSRELFKCVMDDEARGIFQGKVIVRQDAQKTDGKQSSHALLLSPTAEFDAKPELEIYADDVVCGHGATSGDLDENLLFYLRARGIPEKKAKSMLISAFVAESFDDVDNEAVRDVLKDLADSWLAAR